MKKLVFLCCALWVVLLLFAACEKNGDALQVPESFDREQLTFRIGYSEALKIALKGAEMLESSAVTRVSSGRRRVDPAHVKYLITPATRAGETPDTLMYVFNFADSAGFALVATARESDQLLAVTEKGSYTPGEETGNPGFDLYMRCAENYLSTLSVGGGIGGGHDLPGPREFMYKLESYDDVETVGPFVTVRWGQWKPYNMYCYSNSGQEYPSGCAATAIAQIMSYYSSPSSISLTYNNADVQSQVLNWNVIKRHVRTFYCGSDCTEHQAIGRLVREIGKQLNMKYSINRSSASPSKVPGCFSHFGYSSSALCAYNYHQVVASLKNKKIAYVRGEDVVEGGHGWVVDGYKSITRTIKIWKVLNALGSRILDSEEVRIYDYIHCNWGWDGDNNGYFNNGSFNVKLPHELDPGCSNNESFNFTLSLKMVKDISPR